MEGDRDDNPVIDSNIEETETGKTDGVTDSEMAEKTHEEKADVPVNSDTENVIEIS